MFKSLPFGARLPPPPTRDFFIYSTQPRKLKPGETCAESVAIMREGDFLCQGLTKTCTRPFQFQIRSSHNDRVWSNYPLHSDLLSTDKTFLFPEPVLIPRASHLMVEFRSLDSTRQKKDNVVSLQFIGISINHHPQKTISGEAYFRETF